MFDLLIRNASLIDGSGRPAHDADVAVTGSVIAATGDLAKAAAQTTIDGTGHIVCPGFIDTHTHSDTYLLIEPSAPSKTHQGVTTEIVGNCGASAAPRVGNAQLPSDWASHTYPGSWRTVGEYRTLLDAAGPAPNVVMLVGHNTLHGGVVGYGNQAATPDQRKTMVRILEEAMADGARGISTGLVYMPGKFADQEELMALLKTVAHNDGIYTSHIRNESDAVLAALDEALALGQAAGVRTVVSHLKASGRKNWRHMDAILERMEQAREQGIDAAADRYPYTASCTDLDIVFPDWAAEGGRDAVLERLRDSSTRDRLRGALEAERDEEYWSSIIVGSTSHPDNISFQGMPLPDVAQTLGLSPIDAVLRLIDTDSLRTSAFFNSMDCGNMLRVLAEPYVMIGSDASLRAPTGPLSREYPHPRAYGSHARMLRMALDGETVSIEEAIRKMTSLPAERFRLAERGLIQDGYKADLVVFDPTTVRDKATYAIPHQFAEGIDHVIVNGTMTLSNGVLTGEHAGEVL